MSVLTGGARTASRPPSFSPVAPGRVAGLLSLLAMTLLAGCDQGTDTPATTSQLPSPGPVPTTTATSSSPPSPSPSTSFTPLPKVFDNSAMQDSVFKVLSESFQVENLETVICPKDKPVKTGTKFYCTARIDGANKKVPIKVTSDEGAYDVSAPE